MRSTNSRILIFPFVQGVLKAATTVVFQPQYYLAAVSATSELRAELVRVPEDVLELASNEPVFFGTLLQPPNDGMLQLLQHECQMGIRRFVAIFVSFRWLPEALWLLARLQGTAARMSYSTNE
jgi:hypothetical protein